MNARRTGDAASPELFAGVQSVDVKVRKGHEAGAELVDKVHGLLLDRREAWVG